MEVINLLPTDYKHQLGYARRNTVLRKWLSASVLGVAGICLIIAAGWLFISRTTITEQEQVAARQQQLAAQNLEATQKRVAEISDNIKLASDVLSRQVLFSKLLAQVGAVMPNGTSLVNLSINAPEGGIDLTAGATNYQTATQLQVNLQDPANKIFEKADIVSINCAQTATRSDYPCQVNIRALFAKENTFQYSAIKKAGSQ